MQIVIGRAPTLTRSVAPVNELGTLLEARTAFSDQAGLVHTDALERRANRGERPLAHSQDADVRGFHQGNVNAIRGLSTQRACQIACRDPSGRTATHDEQPFNRVRTARGPRVLRAVFQGNSRYGTGIGIDSTPY